MTNGERGVKRQVERGEIEGGEAVLMVVEDDDEFERWMFALERSCGDEVVKTAPSLVKCAQKLQNDSTISSNIDIAHPVYPLIYRHWRKRRFAERCGKPIVAKVKAGHVSSQQSERDSYEAFRKRELKPRRKSLKKDGEGKERLSRLLREMKLGGELGRLVSERERLNRESVGLDWQILEQRVFVRRLRAALGVGIGEETWVGGAWEVGFRGNEGEEGSGSGEVERRVGRPKKKAKAELKVGEREFSADMDHEERPVGGMVVEGPGGVKGVKAKTTKKNGKQQIVEKSVAKESRDGDEETEQDENTPTPPHDRAIAKATRPQRSGRVPKPKKPFSPPITQKLSKRKQNSSESASPPPVRTLKKSKVRGEASVISAVGEGVKGKAVERGVVDLPSVAHSEGMAKSLREVNGGLEHEGAVQVTDEESLEECISRWADLLAFSMNERHATLQLYQRTTDHPNLSRKRRPSTVAACLYYICQLADKPIVMKDIAKIAGCTEATLKNAYKLLYENREEFGKDLELAKSVGVLVAGDEVGDGDGVGGEGVEDVDAEKEFTCRVNCGDESHMLHMRETETVASLSKRIEELTGLVGGDLVFAIVGGRKGKGKGRVMDGVEAGVLQIERGGAAAAPAAEPFVGATPGTGGSGAVSGGRKVKGVRRRGVQEVVDSVEFGLGNVVDGINGQLHGVPAGVHGTGTRKRSSSPTADDTANPAPPPPAQKKPKITTNAPKHPLQTENVSSPPAAQPSNPPAAKPPAAKAPTSTNAPNYLKSTAASAAKQRGKQDGGTGVAKTGAVGVSEGVKGGVGMKSHKGWAWVVEGEEG
ncbi:Enhancer of polycomb-like protein 1 [Rhizophlyctis rosea]|nr:Enhancer of polycomb-like protein 1 [Rhizophlyctis rosea]